MFNEIKNLTEENEHNQARINASCMLNNDELKVEYMALQEEQERVGYMVSPNMARRDEADKKLFKLAETNMTSVQYAEFRKAF